MSWSVVVWMLAGGVLYPIPLVIACARDHPNFAPIAVVTLLLGWTGLGWIVALAWSLAAINRPPVSRPAPLRS